MPNSAVMKPASSASRREALFVCAVWVIACAYTVGYSALFGYGKSGYPTLILGIPSWVVWGVLAPWFACLGITLWFAGFRMTDEPLGESHDEVTTGE